MLELHQTYGEFRINLDEQESVLSVDLASYSSLFTRVNKPHLGCMMIPLHINLRRNKR
jgi:hypothetical protein